MALSTSRRRLRRIDPFQDVAECLPLVLGIRSSISTAELILAGIRDVVVITTSEDTAAFRRLLGDGAQFGISITYGVQPSADELAQACVIGADHIGTSSVALILGDNLFYGPKLGTQLA